MSTDNDEVFTSIPEATRPSIMAGVQQAPGKNLFIRLRWAAIDKTKVEKLVGHVHFLIRGLWDLLLPFQNDDLQASTEAIALRLVALNNEFDQLTVLHDALASGGNGALGLAETDGSVVALAKVKALRIALDNDPQTHRGLTNAEVEEVKRRKFLKGLEHSQSSTLRRAAQVGIHNDGKINDSEPDEWSNTIDYFTPKRRELLQKIEHLSYRKLNNFTLMRKTELMATAEYDGSELVIEIKPIQRKMWSKRLPRVENLIIHSSRASDTRASAAPPRSPSSLPRSRGGIYTATRKRWGSRRRAMRLTWMCTR